MTREHHLATEGFDLGIAVHTDEDGARATAREIGFLASPRPAYVTASSHAAHSHDQAAGWRAL